MHNGVVNWTMKTRSDAHSRLRFIPELVAIDSKAKVTNRRDDGALDFSVNHCKVTKIPADSNEP